jgi:Ca2+/H+ antiporter
MKMIGSAIYGDQFVRILLMIPVMYLYNSFFQEGLIKAFLFCTANTKCKKICVYVLAISSSTNLGDANIDATCIPIIN